MEKRYAKITRFIPALEDHGPLFMRYLGLPPDGDHFYLNDESFRRALVSPEYEALFRAIHHTFKKDEGWWETLTYKGIVLKEIFDLDLEIQPFEIVVALLLYLTTASYFEDKLVEAFQNGFMLRLLKRLDALDQEGAIPESLTRDFFTWSLNDLSVLRLRLELRRDYLSDHEKIMLKRYGEAPTGECISRDILIPSDMPLHNLHYAIQRLFGWQNSHLRRFYLPDAIYENLTGGKVKGWADLVGILFQPPSEGDHDLFWDDDYESGSVNSWLKKKYTGPYHFHGLLEVPAMARRDLEAFLDFCQDLEVKESFSSFLERLEEDENAKLRVLRRAPAIELTLDELHRSVIMDNGTERLLERLTVKDVLAAVGQPLAQEDLFPLTHELLYNYDFGDNWEISIRRMDHADDLIHDHKASMEEIRQGVAYVLTRHQPICLYKEGLSPMDDVGGLSGFARFLYDVYEGEDRKESAALLRWAKSLGWNPNKKAITKLL